MTTVISRLYADEATAHGVVDALRAEGFPQNTIDTITQKDADAIAATRINADDAAIYANRMEAGNVLVVVRAPLTPFGAARRAMAIVDEAQSIPAGIASPNLHITEAADPRLFLSILPDHPRFLSSDVGPDSPRVRGTVSDGLGWPLLSKHRTKRSASSGWFTSTKLLPFPLLSGHRTKRSAISGGKRMLYNPSKST
ncbi:hypothetical protein [Aestuariivita sp.]|jgi:hypothetical protein|uniref:hypothetical protein n=1 Tax=Aestuariivita sp. TaxID=1872407 RepID=UPI002171596D|nr:hypothetical protein [Aestuariivita sp.]MCE8006225.1 hypothetical protein [Aestuariivita sp.]